MEDRCVICGELVPEGSQVCKKCDCNCPTDWLENPQIIILHPAHRAASLVRKGGGRWNRKLRRTRTGSSREE